MRVQRSRSGRLPDMVDRRLTALELGMAATANVILAVYRKIYENRFVPQADKDALTVLVREMKAHVFGGEGQP